MFLHSLTHCPALCPVRVLQAGKEQGVQEPLLVEEAPETIKSNEARKICPASDPNVPHLRDTPAHLRRARVLSRRDVLRVATPATLAVAATHSISRARAGSSPLPSDKYSPASLAPCWRRLTGAMAVDVVM